MIIELIEVRKTRAFGPMRCFQGDIPLPRQLSELYTTLLSRYAANDPENQGLSSTALKGLAASHRPLSILELAWAVALARSRHATTVDALSMLVDHGRVIKLILPFMAQFDPRDVTKRQILPTHHSVNEFIMNETASQAHLRSQDTVPAETEQTWHQRFESLEAFILDICIGSKRNKFCHNSSIMDL